MDMRSFFSKKWRFQLSILVISLWCVGIAFGKRTSGYWASDLGLLGQTAAGTLGFPLLFGAFLAKLIAWQRGDNRKESFRIIFTFTFIIFALLMTFSQKNHSPTPSFPVPSAAPLASLSATNATSGLRIVSGTGFQDMPLGCSAEVVDAIMGQPQEKKVYGTDVYYSYKLSTRLTYLERRSILHKEKDIGFVFDQANLELKKIFIEDSVAVKTDRGIEFGDSVKKVLKLYGTPTKTSSDNIGTAFQGWLAFRNDGITFDFHAGVVTGFDILGTPKQ